MSLSIQKRFVLVCIDKVRMNAAIMWKWLYTEVMLNEKGVISHRHEIYSKFYQSCDELINENTEYNKCLYSQIKSFHKNAKFPSV